VLKIFFSFGFDRANRLLAGNVQGLLESHGAQVVTGQVLGGQQLTPAVMSLIEQSHALVALLTPDERKANGRYACSQWVRDELNFARAKGKLAIALVDARVELGSGAYQGHERIDYQPKALLQAILKLSATIGEWKRQTGRLVKVQILPDTLGRQLAGSNGIASCKARLITNSGVCGSWQDARVLPEIGGAFAYVPGAQDEMQVQLRATVGAEVWVSVAEPQWMRMTLQKER